MFYDWKKTRTNTIVYSPLRCTKPKCLQLWILSKPYIYISPFFTSSVEVSSLSVFLILLIWKIAYVYSAKNLLFAFTLVFWQFSALKDIITENNHLVCIDISEGTLIDFNSLLMLNLNVKKPQILPVTFDLDVQIRATFSL